MVALKEVKINDTCNKNDLIREANILSSCDHENIVKLHAVCYENSILKYLMMEYMNFGDLHSFLIRVRSQKVNINLLNAYYILITFNLK
jgi:serine/threonine protein kinase